jgi:hypothetical protein
MRSSKIFIAIRGSYKAKSSFLVSRDVVKLVQVNGVYKNVVAVRSAHNTITIWLLRHGFEHVLLLDAKSFNLGFEFTVSPFAHLDRKLVSV